MLSKLLWSRSSCEASSRNLVICLGAHLDGGGVLNYTLKIACGIREIAPTLDFVILAPSLSSSRDYLTSISASVFEYPAKSSIFRPFAELLSIFHIFLIVRRLNPSVLHAHTTIAGLYTLVCSCLLNKRFVYTGHGLRYAMLPRYSLKRAFVRAVESLLLCKADLVTFLSHNELTEAIYLVGHRPCFRVINTRIDVPQPSMIMGDYVISCGTLDHRKNPHKFIDIACRSLAHDCSIYFVWVGDGPLLNECRLRVESLGLSGRIRFLGPLSNHHYLELLDKSFLFLLTSRAEALPLCVIEAQLSFKPVVSTAYSGYSALIPDPRFGFVYSEESDEEACSAISALIVNHVLYRDIASNAYSRAVSCYSDSILMAREYSEIYASFLG
jgi:glycosyltransferase involved in cell wall biosynthesis